MAGDFLQAFQIDILERAFGKYSTADVTASTLWVHLYATTLNDAATPATTGRCPGANYTPTNVPNTTTNWALPTSATTSVSINKTDISFTTSASTGWGTIKSVMVTSSSGTGGVGYTWSDLNADQTVSLGNTVTISTGALTFGLK